MSDVHCYFGLENLNLTATQRNTLVARLQALGVDNAGFQPCNRNHWRVRLDNQAVLFEALFDEDTLSIAAVKQYLADLFSVDVATITHSTQQVGYGLVVTFTRSGVDYVRSLAFGYNGGWPAWAVSRDAVLSYLKTNAAAWGDE